MLTEAAMKKEDLKARHDRQRSLRKFPSTMQLMEERLELGAMSHAQQGQNNFGRLGSGTAVAGRGCSGHRVRGFCLRLLYAL